MSRVVVLRDGRLWRQGPWEALRAEADDLLALVQQWSDGGQAEEPEVRTAGLRARSGASVARKMVSLNGACWQTGRVPAHIQ